jgi:ubiquinone/menaquinone biosynthesis C-methylase UbiE
MTDDWSTGLADQKGDIAAIYEDGSIAGSYLEKRMRFSWQRLLHERQAAVLRDAVATYRPANVLEVAPGPARLSTELTGITRGTMVENSEEMINIARARLKQHGLADRWQLKSGDAFKLTSLVPAASFDLAYTFRFLRHFRDKERLELYALLRETLKPGGLLAFDVVNAVTLAKAEADNPRRSAGEIAIYDVSYSAESFASEMKASGFKVIALNPVVKHFDLQSRISYKLDDRIRPLSAFAVRCLELAPTSAPLEWVAVCQKA